MLSHLLESTPRRARPRFGTFVSLIAHALIVSGAVAAARPVPTPPKVESLIPLHPPRDPAPVKCSTCGSRSRGGQRDGHRFEFVVPHVMLKEPTIEAPNIDAAGQAEIQIGQEEWQHRGPIGRPTDTASAVGGEFVDRQVVPFSSNPSPVYPEALRAARIDGSVSARFVVDTTGNVIMESVVVDATAHRLFAEAVVEALRRSRFKPAELRGRKVRQLVVQPFLFVLRS
jgi:periplasmic protein TonB